MQYNHIFGPVPSRRLGISLGVDLVIHKICSLDCIYCECGKTTRLTIDQKEYVALKDVRTELDHFFKHNKDPDYITFSGSGEPTLNSRLAEAIEYIKEEKPNIKVAVLTNATLFFNPGVRKALLRADLVIPSLDAVSKKNFIKINRPHKDLDIHKIITGIQTFAKEYKGRIWLEVLILPGMNNSRSELLLLKQVIEKINPEQIQINTLDRPGTLPDIKPASKQDLEKVVQTLGFDNCEIIAKVRKNVRTKIQRKDVKQAIVETIHRRPCTKDDLLKMIGLEKHDIDHYIKILETENKIIAKTQARGVFYQTVKE